MRTEEEGTGGAELRRRSSLGFPLFLPLCSVSAQQWTGSKKDQLLREIKKS